MRLFVGFLCFGCLLSVEVNSKKTLDNSNKTLLGAAKILKRLAAVRQQLFARTFYKINPKKLISTLEVRNITIYVEGVSTFAGLPKSYFDEPVDITLKDIYENINMISSNVPDLTPITGVSNNNLSMMGVEILGASRQMDDYNRRKLDKYETPLEFLRYYDSCNIDEKVPLILNSFAWSVPADVAVKTHFHQRKFQATQSLIVQYFFQTYLLQYVRIGIENNKNKIASLRYYDNNGHHNKTDLDGLRNYFIRDYKQLKKILVDLNVYYRSSFFPGFAKEDVIRPAIDCIVNSWHCYSVNESSSDNCNIAHYIARNMTERYPWRNFAAIVSDTTVRQDDYADFGFPNRTIVENYDRKTVLLFMTTKNTTANYENFSGENTTKKISSQEINGRIDSLLNYAKYGKYYVQMAVFNERVNPCFAVVEKNIGEQVYWERNDLKLGAYVVF